MLCIKSFHIQLLAFPIKLEPGRWWEKGFCQRPWIAVENTKLVGQINWPGIRKFPVSLNLKGKVYFLNQLPLKIILSLMYTVAYGMLIPTSVQFLAASRSHLPRADQQMSCSLQTCFPQGLLLASPITNGWTNWPLSNGTHRDTETHLAHPKAVGICPSCQFPAVSREQAVDLPWTVQLLV